MRNMIDTMDEGRLRPRYWVLFALLILNTIIEFFDFFIVGFLVGVIGPQWNLTIGETTAILLSGGMGQLLGSLPMAWLADRFGRRPIILLGTLLYAGAAGLIALVPDGSWGLVTLLRFLVGVGYSGVTTTQLALLVEFSPTRYRTIVAGSAGAFAPIGVLLAAASVGYLLPALGWRGLAALGATPILLALLLFFVLPESVRWLLVRGRENEARATLAKYVEMPSEFVVEPVAPAPRRSILDLYRVDPRRFWMIVLLNAGLGMGAHTAIAWGPVFLSLIAGIGAAEAARWFAPVAIAGLAGRVVFTFLPALIGRRMAALISCVAAALLLSAAGLFPAAYVGAIPFFFLCLLLGEFFWNGGFTNILPYASEMYPVSQAAQGAALAQTASGLAKLAGPAVIGLVAGSKAELSREAALAAVTPGYLILAGCAAIAAAALLMVRFETHGQRMRLR